MSQSASKYEDDVEWFWDVKQRSEEWYELRRGIPTASTMIAVQRHAESKTRTALMRRLVAENLSGIAPETYCNDDMWRGVVMEPAALEQYAFQTGQEIDLVGFVRRTISDVGMTFDIGASPDGVIKGKKRLVQIKTMRPDLMIALMESDARPSEHMVQIQSELLVTGYDECDLGIFYEGMPAMPIYRFGRDEEMIRDLRKAAETFSWQLRQLEAKIRKNIARNNW